MYTDTDGIILREVKYKEADRILNVFSRKHGLITVKAPGALRKNSKTAAATQQLTYADMTLFERMGRFSVKEASIKEDFSGLRNDMSAFSLGCYFAECVSSLCPEETPDESVLQLILNSLFALANDLYPQLLIKAVFELRLTAALGYMPQVSSCVVCGEENPNRALFSPEHGGLICAECCRSFRDNSVALQINAVNAVRYIVSAAPKKIFSLVVPEASLYSLAEAAEKYLMYYAGRSFGTLDYWKKVRL